MNAVLNNAKACAIIVARNPFLTILGILSLVLGIGANTSVFNIVNAMTLVPHCVHVPESLVTALTNHPACAVDEGGDFELVESQTESKGGSTGFESSVLAADTPENEVQLVAGNESAIRSRTDLPKNQAVGSGCGRSRQGASDLAAAACAGYVLQLQ